MSRTTTDVTFNVTGQTVAYRTPQGRPTSATFSVFNDSADDDSTAEFTGTATVDSVSTTIDVASGPAAADPQKISLTATTGIVTTGQKYLISEGGRSEWVSPIQVVSADYIRVRHPLKNDYTTAATFVSATITAEIDSTWVVDAGNLSDHLDPNPSYRIRWAILVGSSTYIAYSYFDLVRAPIVAGVDIDDINARAPGLIDSMPPEYAVEQGRPLVDAAWRSVQAELAALQIDTDAIRDEQILDELVILRALCLLSSGGWRPLGYANDLGGYITVTRTEYDRFLEKNFQAVMTRRLSTGSGGGSEIVPARACWSK